MKDQPIPTDIAAPSPYGASITVDNVNEALPLALQFMAQHGQLFTSRGKQTVEIPGPVTTIYRSPARRVLFDPVRDANPFFHLIEAMWILSGSNMAALPCKFLERYKDFSDDGLTLHGAYGYRLRHWPRPDYGVIDQLHGVVDLLRRKPDTRQAVVSIWDPARDLSTDTKDMPCNDMIFFGIRDGRLHMTVLNRSNDVIWGAYGANVVHFSILQEWIAAALEIEVGQYVQMSNSFHVYTDNPFWQQFTQGNYASGHVHNPYMDRGCTPIAIATSAVEATKVLEDCGTLDERANKGFGLTHGHYHSRFFKHVIVPSIVAYELYKKQAYDAAITTLRNECAAPDWSAAMQAWVLRRASKAAAIKNGAH